MAHRSHMTVEADSVSDSPALAYRAELKRRSVLGTSTYYDAGEFCPYTLDTLVETLHAESRLQYESLVLNLEIVGGCSQALLDSIARKFARLTGPKVRVVVRNGGHASMLEGLLARARATTARRSS